MKIGIFLAATSYAALPHEVARACEERGFESFWVPEHTHIPTSRRTPFPGGGELPREYSHLHDPWIALASAASATQRILLGSAICLVVEHDPIALAKRIASVDVISGGRVVVGVGAGWNREEMENHGTDPSRRLKLLHERIAAMKEIWTHDAAEYHGELVSFDPIWSWPKPVQRPHPPILLGTSTGRGRQRVVDYCDGWLPVAIPEHRIGEVLADLRERAERAGRAPESISVSWFWATPEEDALRRLANHGIERAILALPATSLDRILPRLDRYVELMRKVS
jgi:probable F420-dependent oxidoreductase